MQRYSRQYTLSKVGKEGQERLLKSRIVIVGAGALGSRAAELLARVGLGEIAIIDDDKVELDNLQRQALYSEKDIGCFKAEALERKLKEINSSIKIKGKVARLSASNLSLLDYDLVLDCTDNLEARFLINEYCKKNKIPWVYCAVIKTRGSIASFTPDKGYCFSCIFKHSDKQETAATSGILNTTVAMASAIQVTEAIKIILGQKPSPFLLRFNIWEGTLEKIKLKKSSKCPLCNPK